MDEGQDAQAHAPADDDSDFRGDVSWCVFGAESLGAYIVVRARGVQIADMLEFYYLPMMLPAQYPIRYMAATVVFFVYPATLLEIKLSSATKGVGLACVR